MNDYVIHELKSWANYFKLYCCVLEKCSKPYNLLLDVIGAFCAWKWVTNYSLSAVLTQNDQNSCDIVPLSHALLVNDVGNIKTSVFNRYYFYLLENTFFNKTCHYLKD